MRRGLVFATFTFAFLSIVHAAELDGVRMPDEQMVYGTRLLLNGIGVRTYSIFDIRIYVAGLYLQQRSSNPEQIIHSPGLKLLVFHFLHNVSAAEARKAWEEGFKHNCQPPCFLDPHDVAAFLAGVPAAHRGDTAFLLFSPSGVRITDNGRLLGSINNRHFADVLLDTFIGPVPPTAELKRGLLGLAN